MASREGERGERREGPGMQRDESGLVGYGCSHCPDAAVVVADGGLAFWRSV